MPPPEPPGTVRVLPMQLQIGDRMTDSIGEWQVVGRPYTTAGGKNSHVRVQRVDKPGVTETRFWGSYEKVTVIPYLLPRIGDGHLGRRHGCRRRSGTRGHTRGEGCPRLCVRRWYQRGRRAADGRRRRHRHERDLPADQGVRRRLLCPGTPVARSRRPMGREDRQSLPLLARTPRVRVRPRELTGEVAARCERGGPFCIYFLHCHELRTGNTPKRLATSVRPNPSLHPTRYSGLRPLPRAGELKRSAGRKL